MSKLLDHAGALAQAIEAWCEATYAEDDHRTHLGASVLGRACDRELWMTFRWLSKDSFERVDRQTGEKVNVAGRLRRLFSRGHSNEDKVKAMLRGVGVEVWDTDPKTGKQYQFADSTGHLGGSLDGIVRLPAEFGGLVCLLEMKTFGEDGWKALKHPKTGGVDRAHPEHVQQFNCYAFAYELPFVLYIGTRKSTDELHVEIREADFEMAKRSLSRGLDLIQLKTPPPKISANPSDYRCQFCRHRGVCRFGETVSETNCRTCKHATPVDGGRWHCGHFDREIPKDFIAKGCAHRELIL